MPRSAKSATAYPRRRLPARLVARSSDNVPYSMLWTMWEALARREVLGPGIDDIGPVDAIPLD
jgi:hypothetical protein